MQLDLIQLGAFREALKKVFSLSDFELLLKDRLGKDIEDYTPPARKDLAFSSVLQKANDEEWIDQLAIAVRAVRPRNVGLRRVLEEFGLLTPSPPDRDLQRIIDESNAFINVHDWLGKLTDIEGQVCRIVHGEGASAKPIGSGFLAGPSTVITNQHVISNYENGPGDPKRLRAQFDHYVLSDGSVRAGTFVPMHADWLLASSPPSPLDYKAHPIEEEGDPAHLDYALLRLNRAVGSEPIPPAVPGTDLPVRGWIDLTKHGPNPATGAAVFIVQHPAGAPLKLALDTRSLLQFSPGNWRVRYRTNTERGSSGSPVFNQEWELVALHHAGDPDWVSLPEYNEGIPIEPILNDLERKNVLSKLGD